MLKCPRSANNSSNCFGAGLGSCSLLRCLCSLSFISFFGAVFECGDEPCGFHRCETDAHQGRKVRRGGVLVLGLVAVTLWICKLSDLIRDERWIIVDTPPPHTPPAGLGCPTCPIRSLLFVSVVVAVESTTRPTRSAATRTGEATDRGCSCGAPPLPGLPIAPVLLLLVHSLFAEPQQVERWTSASSSWVGFRPHLSRQDFQVAL